MSSPTDGIVSNSYANSMWLTAITFLTVGYGDVTPKTYCGRAVAIIVGLMVETKKKSYGNQRCFYLY